MSQNGTLSLPAAVLINLNVMVGSGIFVNTVLMSQAAGGLCAGAYLLVGLLLLPLIFSISYLAQHHRGGNFYEYAANAHPFIGFLAATAYFLGKLGSCSLGIHVCVSLLQTVFPALAQYPTLMFDFIILGLFSFLNTRNMKTGTYIQAVFMTCKLFPILFVIIAGLFLCNPHFFAPEFLHPQGMIASMPFALYAFSGFEMSCSINRSLKNPEKNASLAILISYILGICLIVTYQTLFYGSLGTTFAGLKNYLEAYPALLNIIPLSASARHLLHIYLHLGIAASSLGAAYGIMYGNSWNLYDLASRGHILKSSLFTRLNKYAIPVLCVCAEAGIVASYLYLSQGNQVPLQQISSFGMSMSYTLVVAGLLFIALKNNKNLLPLPLLGLGSCILLLTSNLKNMAFFGALPALALCTMLGLASIMFWRQRLAKL